MPERSVLEERFAAIVEALAGIEGVTVGAGRRGFGPAPFRSMDGSSPWPGAAGWC
jgi:hypothetical protein